MPQRKYNKEREQVTKINKRVILLILLQEYNKCAEASESFRTIVDGASFPCFARTQARCPAVRHVCATFMPR